MKWRIVALILALSWNSAVHSSLFDFLEDIFVDDVADGLKKAGEWIGDRFRDTKATRAIDHYARIAAYESSLRVATAVLDASKLIADQTLKGAHDAAYLAVLAAEAFLREVVQRAAFLALEGPKQAAEKLLEGAKHSTLGVLEGGKWLTNNSLGQIDVNCIHYDGNLQDLVRGDLGNVEIRGKIIKPFSMRMDLNLSDPIASVVSAAANIGELMESAFLKPFMENVGFSQAVVTIQQGGQEADKIQHDVQSLQLPPELVQAQQESARKLQEFEQKKKELEAMVFSAKAAINRAAALSYDQLLEFIQKQGTSLNRETVIYRQQFAKLIAERERLKAKAQEPMK